jgi:hypothetical protein
MLLPFKVHEEDGKFVVRDGWGHRYDVLTEEGPANRIAHLMTVATEQHRHPISDFEVKAPGRCEWIDLAEAAKAGYLRRKDGVDAGACAHGD